MATLERFVNTDPDVEPADLVAIPADVDTGLPIETVHVESLPPEWRMYPAPSSLAMIGEQWLRASTSVVISIPSAVIPHERNFVLNPAHADFGKITIHESVPFTFDPRMWKR